LRTVRHGHLPSLTAGSLPVAQHHRRNPESLKALVIARILHHLGLPA
jgi:hypothetical protein